MRNNQPVTQREVDYSPDIRIISMTDLQGNITFVNRDFIQVSGFTEEELVGNPHNMVRHPDMPPAAYEDLWSTIKAGKTWRELVKNRCKNGDHYWVDAYVMPIVQNGKAIGYQSVRSKPSREQITEAEALYARMRNDTSIKIPHNQSWKDWSISIKAGVIGGMAIITSAILLMDKMADYFKADAHPSMAFSALHLINLLTTIGVLLFMHFGITQPVKRAIQYMINIANGDLTEQLPKSDADETGQLLLATRMVQSRLLAIFGRVGEACMSLSAAAEQLSASSEHTLDSMYAQQGETTQVATAMQQMSATVREVANNTEQAAHEAQSALDASSNGLAVATQARNVIGTLATEVQRTGEVVANVANHSQQISTITDVISSIAEQTNLLALNAAIEAARAGEQGRGFAVVADEVRSLAGRTQQATGQIRSMIEKLSLEVSHAVNVMQQSREMANSATEEIAHTEEALMIIAGSVNQLSSMNGQIATAADQQSSVASEMSQNVENIDNLTKKSREDAEQVTRSSQYLMGLAHKLQGAASQFKLGGDNLDFQAAQDTHRMWVKKLEAYLAGDKSQLGRDVITNHHHCMLGRWYYGVGMQRYGQHPLMKELEAPHAELHRTAETILKWHEAGKEAEARAQMDKLRGYSNKIIDILEQLKRVVIQ